MENRLLNTTQPLQNMAREKIDFQVLPPLEALRHELPQSITEKEGDDLARLILNYSHFSAP
jgi:hypothetical protein